MALGDMGSVAAPALRVITPTLDYRADRGYTESIAAQALAGIGPAATPAVPSIVNTIRSLMNDTSQEAGIALVSLIVALGKIGPGASPAIPVLAENLSLDSSSPSFYAAWSISQIAQQKWPNADLQMRYAEGIVIVDWDNVMRDDNDVPAIEAAAREWWETNGKYQDWE